MGLSFFKGADSGTWTPGPVELTTYDDVRVGGARAVGEARCRFSFSGQSSSGATVTGQSKVTLSAGSTMLRRGGQGVLVNGDEASDSYGNTLRAQSTRRLRTS